MRFRLEFKKETKQENAQSLTAKHLTSEIRVESLQIGFNARNVQQFFVGFVDGTTQIKNHHLIYVVDSLKTGIGNLLLLGAACKESHLIQD